MADHLTELPDNRLIEAGDDAVERARALHHLASADPEIDGELTAEEHAAKYGLGRPEVPRRRAKHEAPEGDDVEGEIETAAAPRASDQ